MTSIAHDQLRVSDGRLTITDSKRNPLLNDCTAAVQLNSGVRFSLDAMETVGHATAFDAVVTAGGDHVLPRLTWHTRVIDDHTLQLTLKVTNTTNRPLPIERLDVLVCVGGYKRIDSQSLSFRRTGWQSFSPASVRQPFTMRDPWLQPPLYAPALPTGDEGQRQLPWMTVLQSSDIQPLLLGFCSAKDYLGMIMLRDDNLGHAITCSNYAEGVDLAPGQSIESEPLMVTWGKDEEQLLSDYAETLGDAMGARKSERPTGWCSWNYYFHTVTEQDIAGNVATMRQKTLPFKYVQIDDGYQAKFGDWLRINDQFPSGMKHAAETIKKAGYVPGIWIAPFMAEEESEVFQQHPEWFIHDSAGRPFNVNRYGDQYWPSANYGLDLTHPEACAWIKEVLRTMCQDWGFEYLKVDYLYSGCQRGVRYDPTATSVQAFRKGLELLREVAGDRYLVGCGSPLLPSVGVFDAMRVSADIMPSLPKNEKRVVDVTRPLSRDNIAALWSHAWMNGRLWVNDPDTVRVRQHHIESGWPEITGLAVMVALTAGSVMDSDNLQTLEPEGYRLLQRLFPMADVRAKPVGKLQNRPSKLLAHVERGDGQWYIAARYNWSRADTKFRMVPAEWQMPVGRYHMYDLIAQRYIGLRLLHRTTVIPAYGAGLLSLCPASDHPQLVATKNHLLGPAGDIAEITWRDNTLDVRLNEGRIGPVTMYIHVPSVNYSLVRTANCRIVSKEKSLVIVESEGPDCSLRFKSRFSLKRSIKPAV